MVLYLRIIILETKIFLAQKSYIKERILFIFGKTGKDWTTVLWTRIYLEFLDIWQ